MLNLGFPGGSVGKESSCNERYPGSIPGSGRSSGEGNGNPLHYSCLKNPMDRGAWWAKSIGLRRVGHKWSNLACRLQHTRLPFPSLSPGVCSNLDPLSQWCHPANSSSVAPSPPALSLSQHQSFFFFSSISLFQWVGSSHQVAKVLKLQHQSFQWIFMVDFL